MPTTRLRWRSIWVPIALSVFCVWWRAHTFGPAIREAVGVPIHPVVRGEPEPLDCDEAFYAYIGHRLHDGAKLYRDVSENKPPLGYWIYQAAVAVGGYDELAIRILPIPFVVVNLWLLWWIGHRLGGPLAASLGAFLFSITSCDPSLYGNSAQLEHFMNLFSTAGLAALVAWLSGARPRWLVVSGAMLALAALVKQVAVAYAVVACLTMFIPLLGGGSDAIWRCGLNLFRFALGFALVAAAAAMVLLVQGVGPAAYDDVFRFGRALATDTAADPAAPSPIYRWLTGNADPRGELPPPFGTTTYLTWWAGGTWLFWIVSIVAFVYTLVLCHDAQRRIVPAWFVASWAAVVLPGLYWPHYYLLPVPAASLLIGIAMAELARRQFAWAVTRLLKVLTLGISVLLLGGFVLIQAKVYLLTEPRLLTERYKGGRQWVVLRELGRELGREIEGPSRPTILVWGWQSPLYFYGRLDAPSRHAFTNNLMRDHAATGHPLIQPRIDELMNDLRRAPPDYVMAGYPPFPELRAFLAADYRPAGQTAAAPDGRGLWIRSGGRGDPLSSTSPARSRPDSGRAAVP